MIFTCSLNLEEISEMVHMTCQATTVFLFLQRLFIIAKHEEINLITNRTGMSVSFAMATVLQKVKPTEMGLQCLIFYVPGTKPLEAILKAERTCWHAYFLISTRVLLIPNFYCVFTHKLQTAS